MQKVFCNNTLSKILEIACFNLESALIAQNSGADRIELCTNYTMGGLTPSHTNILDAQKQIQIPVHVIIRPHAQGFVYSDSEIAKMKNDILFCKENKIDGIVFGILTSEYEIDINICKELISLAKPMSLTFHRAIDECKNVEKSIEQLIELGFDRVLTSGGKNNCVEGLEILKILQTKFGSKIIIMPGGGIRSSNINEVLNNSYCNEFHSSALLANDLIANSLEIKFMKEILNS